jgi:myo-inositol 2-dehydrogenase/D-chiro-inositol 1-dehydrogenase
LAELKVAVVGCGRMGRERARCAHQAGARINAVYDPDAVRAEALAAQWGARVLTSPEALAHSGVDAAFLCTPPETHGSLAVAAIRAGIAFFVEKPVGTSHDAVDCVEAELARRPVLNAVGYMNRYRASTQLTHRLLAQRDVLGICGYWVCRKYSVPWWLNPGSSGGPLNEQATHLFDLFRFLIGEISYVESINSTPHGNENLSLRAVSSIRFESGALGTIYYSCEASGKDIGARIFTTEGTIALAGWDFQMMENSIDGNIPSVQTEDIFAVETAVFLESVRTGRDLIASNWIDALKTQRVVDVARQCAREAGA